MRGLSRDEFLGMLLDGKTTYRRPSLVTSSSHMLDFRNATDRTLFWFECTHWLSGTTGLLAAACHFMATNCHIDWFLYRPQAALISILTILPWAIASHVAYGKTLLRVGLFMCVFKLVADHFSLSTLSNLLSPSQIVEALWLLKVKRLKSSQAIFIKVVLALAIASSIHSLVSPGILGIGPIGLIARIALILLFALACRAVRKDLPTTPTFLDETIDARIYSIGSVVFAVTFRLAFPTLAEQLRDIADHMNETSRRIEQGLPAEQPELPLHHPAHPAHAARAVRGNRVLV